MANELHLTYPLNKKNKKQKKTSGKKMGWKKKTLIITSIGLVILIILGITSVDNAKAAYTLALEGKEHLVKAQDAVVTQDLKTAADEIDLANQKFQEAKKEFNGVRWAIVIPYAGKQVSGAAKLVDSAALLTESMAGTINAGLNILNPIQSEDVTNFGQLTPKQKGEALNKLNQALPLFEKAKEDITKAEEKLAKIDEEGTREEILEAKNLVQENIPQIQEFLDQALLAAEILPKIAGHPNPQEYLFVSQNNHELRASGGFIGNVGIMRVHEGEILDFTTKGVYNLDAEAPVHIEPPDYLREYLKSTTWYLRDANTCVGCADFAVAAKNILNFYKTETGSENFDGVISITQDFLEDLLAITGPVKVEGFPYTFTAENVTETLQEHVEVNFQKYGISVEDRQSIVSDLSAVILQKTFSLPKEKWFDLADAVQESFKEKHAMVYSKDQAAQAALSEQGWTSELKNDFDQDYLIIADNNMAALKTDQVMDRVINYTVDLQTPEKPTAKLQITYNNKGRFTHFTTRYRTWAQVYVPAEATLTRYEGTEKTDKETPPGEIREEIDENSGRKVWSYFKSIEPGTQETITIEYELPTSVVKDNAYSLVFQKQAGTQEPKLNVNVITDGKPTAVSPGEVAITDENTTTFDTNLLVDRYFDINL